MRRIAAVLVGALMGAACLGAEELKIGTIEGMAAYGPLMIKALKDAGYDAKVTAYAQQADLLQDLAKGRIDGAFFLAQPVIAQVKGAVMVPVRIAFTDFCAVATDPGVKVANPSDLRKYSVGIVKGQPGHAAITRGMTVTEASSDAEEFKMLAAGRFQVAIAVSDLVPIMCKMAGIKTYYIQSPPLLRTPTFLALSAARSGIEPKIEAALKKWVDGGQWDKESAAVAEQARK
jgi:hypothetical protein